MELLDHEPTLDRAERPVERLVDGLDRDLLEHEAGNVLGPVDVADFGSAGMIIAAGPSLPAIQVPCVSTITPSSKLNTSSPKYQTAPSSSWA